MPVESASDEGIYVHRSYALKCFQNRTLLPMGSYLHCSRVHVCRYDFCFISPFFFLTRSTVKCKSTTKLMCLFSEIEWNFVAVVCHAMRVQVCIIVDDRWTEALFARTHTNTHQTKNHLSDRPIDQFGHNEKCIIQSPLMCVCLLCWRDIFIFFRSPIEPFISSWMLAKKQSSSDSKQRFGHKHMVFARWDANTKHTASQQASVQQPTHIKIIICTIFPWNLKKS